MRRVADDERRENIQLIHTVSRETPLSSLPGHSSCAGRQGRVDLASHQASRAPRGASLRALPVGRGACTCAARRKRLSHDDDDVPDQL